MDDLRVFIEGQGVGRLENSTDGQLRFAYDTAWLERPDATPFDAAAVRLVQPCHGQLLSAGLAPRQRSRARTLGNEVPVLCVERLWSSK